MKTKVGVLILVMLLMSLSLTMIGQAGTEQDPEVVDKTFDVKLFGSFPFFPQFWLKNVDVISVWFYEEQSQPDYLFITMKLRDLKEISETYENIYVVDWIYNDVSYGVSVNLLPTGLSFFFAGAKNEERNDYTDFVVCSGSFDEQTDLVTWQVPKQSIGSPVVGETLTGIFPSTHLRFPLSSGLLRMDLFKDLSWNAATIKDYVIQYM